MARRAGALGTLCIALLLGACENGLRPGATSVFELLSGSRFTPVELSVMATDKYDANSRYVGTLGLAQANFAGEPVYVRLFEENLKDTDPMVRGAAIRGLANHGEPRHAETIAESLTDASVEVRIEAARGLQRLHNENVIDALIPAVREANPRDPSARSEAEPRVRAEAATALGQYAQNKVLRALFAALDDSDLAVNRNALASLRTLTGQDFGMDHAAWIDWEDKTEAHFAGRQLYTYPAYSRKTRLYEYIPFVPNPPNEASAAPVGLPR